MQNSRAIINDNISALAQGRDLIARIDEVTYSNPGQHSLEYGAGTHFRHCLNFYNNFLSGVQSGRINYDLRERDERVERDRVVALAEIDSIMKRLARLSPADSHREVLVISESSTRTEWSRSSVMRELQFLLSHTIHHYAIIAVMMRFQGIEPGREFGVAPSTLRRWKESA